LYENEEKSQALENTYFYSSFKVSPTVYRPFLGFPSTIPSSSSTTADLNETTTTTMNFEETLNTTLSLQETKKRPDKYPLHLSFVLIPGLFDLSYFHEILQSTTFNIGIFQDKTEFLSRCFSSVIVDQYSTLLNEEPGGLGLPGSVIPPGLTKKASTNTGSIAVTAAGGGVGQPFNPTLTKLVKSDEFLISSIHNSLSMSSKLQSYGNSRFRLESLLSKSNDLLMKFHMKKENLTLTEDSNQVVVKVR
jgi:hypothetical protein